VTAASEKHIARRRESRFTLTFPDSLPITHARQEIVEAVTAHPVIVVCGDTGSGKTTQLPKLCLAAGRGITGRIGQTQPRRIAARAVAARLAEELDVEVGRAVGFKVRFTDRTNPATSIKVMTDGILLNEIRQDRWLSEYDTLIIDEAHERSLNIDFILGYLKRVVKRRPDFKVIITSATIDPERFASHFDDAPIVRVEGRAFPIELRYRVRERGHELAESIVEAITELASIDLDSLGGGKHRDVLVFVPGERWIRDAELALKRYGPAGFEILPLYARLTAKQQQRVFNPGKAPRIVLATNVAETSLTVPRIRFVIDPGLARISRYGTRHRVQRLAVEPIAQANATQRAGRCGRLGPGVCVRLYSEEDFNARPAFTEPEILRTNLAGVILRLEALGAGSIDEFPFLDAPPAKAVNDAYRLLHVLGAMDAERKLTRDGELMGRLPLDPRLARLLLSANTNGTLREALVLAAALSVMDPREQPADKLESARRQHEEFADPRSDFATYLNLWRAYRRERRGAGKAFRSWCARKFLAPARLREWDDVHAQLKEFVAAFGWRVDGRKNKNKDKAMHQAVLAAFIDYIAERSEGASYRGMHESRAMLFPGSVLAKKRPRWVVAAEHVATERTYLRTVAQINPRWALEVAPHLVKRQHVDAAWDSTRGRITAREVVTLFGLTLSRQRRVNYAAIAPREARELFISQALVADDLGETVPFLEHNRRLQATVFEWEARTRSRDLFVGERALSTFYDKRLPDHVCDRASLLDFCREHAEQLHMRVEQLATRDLDELSESDYPLTMQLAGQQLAVRYCYAPGTEHDGLTLTVPSVLITAIRADELDWLVPGWLPDKVLALLRSLPKDVRRRLVPIPDTVTELLPALMLRFGQQALTSALREFLADRRDVYVEKTAFDTGALEPYLHTRVEILDEAGEVIALGRNFLELQREFGSDPSRTPKRIERTIDPWTRSGLSQWDCGELPDFVQLDRHGARLELYPALIDEHARVDLALLPPGPAASAQHRRGVRRLLLKRMPQQLALVRKLILDNRELLLAYHGIGSTDELIDDLSCAAADESFKNQTPIRTEDQFDRCLAAGRSEFVNDAERLLERLAQILPRYREIRSRLEKDSRLIPAEAAEDMTLQIDELIYPSFLSSTPVEWRPRLMTYLEAVLARLDRIERHHPKDPEFQHAVRSAWQRYATWREKRPPDWPDAPDMVRYRWMIEELRVSLFAQSLRTAVPVSDKRLEEAWAQATAFAAHKTI